MKNPWTWIAATFGLLLAALLTIAFYPGDLEGIWHNELYASCMCDSRNFLLFEDGSISFYSDTHHSDFDIGTYQKREDGLYDVVLFTKGTSPYKWTVRPHRFWWMPPADPTMPPRHQSLMRAFYRPRDSAIDRTIIATAPRRDALIRYEEQKRQKAREAAKLSTRK